jgi:NAD(P)-dependent dehydrogenase (short-subunit alcohol dehydrogenase family)
MKKNVVITGGSGGLGKAVVEQFVSEGYQVIATVSPGKTLGFDIAGVEAFEADLTNEKSVNQVIDSIIKKYSTIDAAVLLVGGFAAGGVKETDGDALKNMYSLNFETSYFVARPLFLQMLNQNSGGRIVFVGSRPALIASQGKGVLAYALSKSLLFKLAEYLNAEGAAKNVVTAVVAPSTIDTPVNRKAMPNADFNSWVKPEEIAGIMTFIASAKASVLRDPVFKVYGKA